MTDEKFSEFADGGDLQPTDQIVGLRSGVNTKFNSPSSSSFLIAINAYVTNTGDDSTGILGDLNKPFKTVAGACSAIAIAGDYSFSKQYNIYLFGVISETVNVQIPPFTNLIGDGSLWNLGGNIFGPLETGSPWDTDGSCATYSNINFTGQTISFPFLGQANVYRNFTWINCLFNLNSLLTPADVTLTGEGYKTNHVFISCIAADDSVGGAATFTTNSIGLKLFGGSYPNLTCTSTQGVTYVEMYGGSIAPSNTFTSTNPFVVKIAGSQSQESSSTVTITGAVLSLYVDASLLPSQIAINSGANVIYFSTSQMIGMPGYSPSNFTMGTPPTGYQNSVLQAIQGIDAKFGTIPNPEPWYEYTNITGTTNIPNSSSSNPPLQMWNLSTQILGGTITLPPITGGHLGETHEFVNYLTGTSWTVNTTDGTEIIGNLFNNTAGAITETNLPIGGNVFSLSVTDNSKEGQVLRVRLNGVSWQIIYSNGWS